MVGIMSQTTRGRIVIPNPKELKTRRKSLPKFKPLELDESIKHPRAHDDPADDYANYTETLRRETNQQMLELLRRLGVDPAQPNAWRNGFFWLAWHHHGVGHFSYPTPALQK
jgi:hypothetical protein